MIIITNCVYKNLIYFKEQSSKQIKNFNQISLVLKILK